jgi:hypothetical protein
MGLISKQQAIEEIEGLVDTMGVSINKDYCFGMRNMKERAISAVERIQWCESVPLSWWNELKDFLKSCKDDPWETITTSAIAELVLNKMNSIEEKGTEKQCF